MACTREYPTGPDRCRPQPDTGRRPTWCGTTTWRSPAGTALPIRPSMLEPSKIGSAMLMGGGREPGPMAEDVPRNSEPRNGEPSNGEPSGDPLHREAAARGPRPVPGTMPGPARWTRRPTTTAGPSAPADARPDTHRRRWARPDPGRWAAGPPTPGRPAPASCLRSPRRSRPGWSARAQVPQHDRDEAGYPEYGTRDCRRRGGAAPGHADSRTDHPSSCSCWPRSLALGVWLALRDRDTGPLPTPPATPPPLRRRSPTTTAPGDHHDRAITDSARRGRGSGRPGRSPTTRP